MKENIEDIFTIVTPSYNQGCFIEETINSVLSQAGDFYIDYIVADGGSGDKTVEILKKFDDLLKENKYPIKCKGINFRWWSEKDRGQSDAINKGFSVARGNYFAYINSDDYYLEDALSRVINVFRTSEADLVYGKCMGLFQSDPKKNVYNIPYSRINFKTLIKNGPQIYQPSTFWTRSVYNLVGPLDVNYHYAMDYDYYLRILKMGRAEFLDHFLSKFRVREGQKSTSIKKLLEEFTCINKRYNGGRHSWYYLKTKVKILFL